MQARELSIGRTFAVVFEPGEDFFTALEEFCRDHQVQQGYIPMFLAALAEAEVVGTCEKLDDPHAPVWSRVHLTNVEAHGCGTLAHDPDTGQILPHIHLSLGLKERSAFGHTSHLLSAKVQFVVEMVLVEVLAPGLIRPPQPNLYNVPLLRFLPD